MGDKLLLNFATISELICNFTYKITKLPIKIIGNFCTSQYQDGIKVLKCYEQRWFRKPKDKKEHIKKDSIRYFVEKM